MRHILLATAALLIPVLPAQAAKAPPAKIDVIDGDTIRKGNVTYRIWGIDAPESGQMCPDAHGGTWACGDAATKAMKEAVTSGDLACVERGPDGAGRRLAVCRVAGLDVGRLLVKEGLAWALRSQSGDYAVAEDDARQAKVGIWEAATETAWDYRTRMWDAAKSLAPNGCPIKGTLGPKGEKLAYAPWSTGYDKAVVNATNGGRWFCDEASAAKAGWRAAGGSRSQVG